MLNLAQDAVKEFNKAFNLPVAESPSLLDPERLNLRVKLLIEETKEFSMSKDVEAQADALIDIIYVALGALVEMGVDGGDIFTIVHDANMNKIGCDGEVTYNCDGKIMKPQGWISPAVKIKTAIDKQKAFRGRV